MLKKFHIASEEDILSGKVTDVYFSRTLEILKAKNIDKHVVMEIRTRSLPLKWEWAVLAGVEEVVNLLVNKKITLDILPEGTLFRPGEPVAEISGMYQEICLFETAILGLLCQATGIATNSARCRLRAGDRTLLSFGARRMHPAIAPMIERSAYIGGADGVSTLAGAELIGIEPSGTMPHALILIMGNTVKAMKAFDEVISKKVRRVALIDTLQDEKFEAINVAESMGKALFAIRFDTPTSRRGNFVDLIKEVRWELNLRGFEHVRVFVSGGIDESKISELNDVVDGYGIGTWLSNSPTIDFAMDIVEIDGKPFAKRGKESGRKFLYRCEKCWTTRIKSFKLKNSKCSCGGRLFNLMQRFVDNGKIAKKTHKPQEIRKYVLEQLKKIRKEEIK
jgi:nicotinate phosphoribosyltransferase